MKVLLDTNVLLDLLLNHNPWAADMAAVWNAHRRSQIEGFLAAFAVPTVFYIIRKQSDRATARTAVADCLATLHIALVDRTTLLAAQAMPGSDFEDNLQIACAIHTGVDLILTRDPQGFAHSLLPVSPLADLVVRTGRWIKCLTGPDGSARKSGVLRKIR